MKVIELTGAWPHTLDPNTTKWNLIRVDTSAGDVTVVPPDTTDPVVGTEWFDFTIENYDPAWNGNVLTISPTAWNVEGSATLEILNREKVGVTSSSTTDGWIVVHRTKSEFFWDAQVKVVDSVLEAERKHVTLTNAASTGYGITDYLFHLSDDPAVVGTLAWETIILEQWVAKDLYLVWPSTQGGTSTSWTTWWNFQHNGTVTGVHFTATFDGTDIVYNVIESVRHHPWPWDFDTRTYNSVVAQQTAALTLLETNFDCLFEGFAVSTGYLYTNNIECYEWPEWPVNTVLENPNTTEVGTTQAANGISWDTIAVWQTFDSVTVLIRNNGTALTGVSYNIEDFDSIISVPTNPVDIPAWDSYVTFTFPEITVTAPIHANGELNLGGYWNVFPSDFVIPHTWNGNYWPFFNANNGEAWIGLVGNGWVVTPEYSVVTLSDDTKIVYDSNWNIVTVDVSTLTPCTVEKATVKQATTDFTSTNWVKVKVWDKYELNADGTTFAIPHVNEYNEFFNNYKPHYLALSYEAAGGANVRINVNGVDATYTDLLNATDAGNGQVNFGGWTNGNFNRRARVDAEVLTEVWDYIEIISPDVAPYSQMIIAITQNTSDLAHSTSGVYNFRTTAWANWGVEAYSFRNKTNTVVNSWSEANATYRITRTLAGVSFSRDWVELYCTDRPEFVDYSTQTNTVTGNTGLYRISEDKPATPINTTTNAAWTNIVTGYDLTQAANMRIEFTFADQATGVQWQKWTVEVDQLLEAYNNGNTVDAYVQIFDNDWMRVNVVDPATGELNFVDQWRDMVYVKSELRVVAQDDPVSNVTATLTSGSISWGYIITFPASIEEDVDGWKQANNQDFVVPSWLDGRYLINATIWTWSAWSNDDLSWSITIVPISWDPTYVIWSDVDSNDTAWNRSISASWAVNLVEWDIVRLSWFANWTQTINRARLTITKLNGLWQAPSVATPVAIDAIPNFANTLKVGNEFLGERSYTVVEDDAPTAETTQRTFDSSVTPFVEIEVVRDNAATHWPMLRANEPWTGRQAQLRFLLNWATNSVASSWANTSDPIVHQVTVWEETIKYLVEFTDPVAHTELEISPAAHDLSLTPSVAATWQTWILWIKLYETNPTGQPIERQVWKASDNSLWEVTLNPGGTFTSTAI